MFGGNLKKIRLWFWLLVGALVACHSVEQEKAEKEIITNINQQLAPKYEKAKTEQVLATELKYLQKENKVSAELIASVFEAMALAQDKDEFNAQSNQLFEQALSRAKLLRRTDLELWAMSRYCFYLYKYRKYEASFPNFMNCMRHLDSMPATEVIMPGETYKRIGYFLMSVGDLPTAETYLLKAKTYTLPNSGDLASILDNLGLVYISANDFAKAESYFKQALVVAQKSGDELRHGKILGNIGDLKYRQKKYDEAVNFLLQDIAFSKKATNTQNTIYALVLLGKVYLAKGEVGLAMSNLKEAQVYAQSKTYFKSNDYEINTLILEIAKQTQNDKEELRARRNIESLKSFLAQSDGKEVIVKMGWEAEKTGLKAKLETETLKREKETLIKVMAIIGCLLLVMLLVFLVKRFKQEIKETSSAYDEKIKKLSLDKASSEQKLVANHQTLQSYKTYLKEKNEQIKELEIELEKLMELNTVEQEEHSYQMRVLLDSHLLENETWIAFKKVFIEKNPEYYQHLNNNFQDLTDANLRVIFLSKLEMNNTEIARILGLTLDAVKKAKQRLRKKYGPAYEELFRDGESLV